MLFKRRRIAALLAALCVLPCAAPTVAAQGTDEQAQTARQDYVAYLAQHKNTPKPHLEQDVFIRAAAYTGLSPENGAADAGEAEEPGALVLNAALDYLEYAVEAPQTGLYEIAVYYRPLAQTGKRSWDFGIALNGESPFSQAASLRLSPVYRAASQTPVTDTQGNEFASGAVVDTAYTCQPTRDPNGIIDLPLHYLLQEGRNTVRLSFEQPEGLVLGGVFLREVSSPPSYETYRGEAEAGGASQIRVEAERFSLLSDSVITPIADSSDPRMSPLDSKRLLLNSINGGTWAKQGQWIQWEVTPTESGWYSLTFRCQQETLKGVGSRRRLSIDGRVPFKEAETIRFPTTSGWETTAFSDASGRPYMLYLEADRTYTVRLEAVLGELAPVIYQVDSILYDLNNLYRKIIMITSTNADKYRDYHLDREIPDLLSKLELYQKRLASCYDRLLAVSDGNAGDYAMLMTLARQLSSFMEEPDTIPLRVLNLQSNLGSVSSMLVDLQKQPLSLDYLTFSQENAVPPAAKAGFFEKAWHSIKGFVRSFVVDYNGLESEGNEETITLWYGGGRDQAEILWRMTNDTFTPQTGIGVNIKIVSASIVEAFLSGQSPDIAINVARDVPVNLALRGGIRRLSDFPDFSSVTAPFVPGALIPYTLEGGVYALPDTQSFNMLFYRRDVLAELDLSVPNTWEEFIEAANQLQLSKLQAAVPVEGDASVYYAQLMQNGGGLFNETHSRVLLDTPVSMKAFCAWTDMYTKTGLPVSYDLFNRFRSGELPLAIAPYTLYGQLESAAPEIRGLWGMALCPGTRTQSGGIDRTVPATGTAAVILDNTRHEEAAWRFVTWWTGSEAQARFAADVETAMGVIARVALANTEAFSSQDWPRETAEAIEAQRAFVREIPQVPGQYYLERDLITAFRDVVYDGRNPLESVKKYGIRINNEIRRKREEFGLA